eukprot:4840476-Heterocapsa_arctica.AAC.1
MEMRAAFPFARPGSIDSPSGGTKRLASLIRAVSSAMASGVEREVAEPSRSMATLRPRLCSQMVLMSQAAAH